MYPFYTGICPFCLCASEVHVILLFYGVANGVDVYCVSRCHCFCLELLLHVAIDITTIGASAASPDSPPFPTLDSVMQSLRTSGDFILLIALVHVLHPIPFHQSQCTSSYRRGHCMFRSKVRCTSWTSGRVYCVDTTPVLTEVLDIGPFFATFWYLIFIGPKKTDIYRSKKNRYLSAQKKPIFDKYQINISWEKKNRYLSVEKKKTIFISIRNKTRYLSVSRYVHVHFKGRFKDQLISLSRWTTYMIYLFSWIELSTVHESNLIVKLMFR